MQLVRPDGQNMDIDLYSMDMKALIIAYDKAENQKVDKIYFDQNGNLDHFIIKVPAEKIKNGSLTTYYLRTLPLKTRVLQKI